MLRRAPVSSISTTSFPPQSVSSEDDPTRAQKSSNVEPASRLDMASTWARCRCRYTTAVPSWIPPRASAIAAASLSRLETRIPSTMLRFRNVKIPAERRRPMINTRGRTIPAVLFALSCITGTRENRSQSSRPESDSASTIGCNFPFRSGPSIRSNCSGCTRPQSRG